ncbi:MAG: sugar ABC transporter permease [Firmicutes bacterium]|nr:sugar ABC transporter permease [Bacillota bacterium]
MKWTKQEIRTILTGLAFASPWLVGFAIFTVYPILASLYYSLTEFTGLDVTAFVGFGNYIDMITKDELFHKSLYNTLYYLILAVPLGFVVAMALALALNLKIKEISFYRTCVYIPNIVPAFASSFIWLWLLNSEYGLVNLLLEQVGIWGPAWVSDPKWAKFSIVLMAQWGAGGSAMIFLASLQDVPRSLYEVADLDGATSWVKFRYITLPMISPVILFHVIMALFGAFQVFTPAYIMTAGGPANSTLFYVLYLYRNAFNYGKMGYASAMAWLLFILALITTLIVMKTSARFVYYQGEER